MLDVHKRLAQDERSERVGLYNLYLVNISQIGFKVVISVPEKKSYFFIYIYIYFFCLISKSVKYFFYIILKLNYF